MICSIGLIWGYRRIELLLNPGSSKQAPLPQGHTPQRGHSPWLKYFLLQSPRRCVGVPVGLLGAAQRFRAGRSNPVAKPWVRAHAPTRNPWGWTAPALQMTWPSRALAAPGVMPPCRARQADPGDGDLDAAVRRCGWGPVLPFLLRWVPPEDPLEDLLLGSSPFSLAFIWAAGCMAVVSPSLVRTPIGPRPPSACPMGEASVPQIC